jgi:hypothetical protein
MESLCHEAAHPFSGQPVGEEGIQPMRSSWLISLPKNLKTSGLIK